MARGEIPEEEKLGLQAVPAMWGMTQGWMVCALALHSSQVRAGPKDPGRPTQLRGGPDEPGSCGTRAELMGTEFLGPPGWELQTETELSFL